MSSKNNNASLAKGPNIIKGHFLWRASYQQSPLKAGQKIKVSGCPPRPEALLDAMIKLQDKIGRERSVKNLTAPKAAAAAPALAGKEA